MLVLGLAAHTHRLGQAVLTLIDQGLQLESAAIVRSAFECGVTAQWMVQYGDDSFSAVMRDAQTKRRALVKTMSELGEFMPLSRSEGIRRLFDDEPEWPSTAADQSAKNFRDLCSNFEVSPFYYFGYRVLSGYAHAGSMVAAPYVESANPVAMVSNPADETSDSKIWLGTTCCALIWAARASDMLTADEPRLGFLCNAADTLGISAEIPMTEKARKARDGDRARRARAANRPNSDHK